MDEETLSKPVRRKRRSTAVAIIILVLLWATAMLLRWEIRTQWWAYRLTKVETREDRLYYLTRLAAAGNRSLNAVSLLQKDPRPEIREMAVTVLEQASAPAADKVLLSMMSDENQDVAMAAASVTADRTDEKVFLEILSRDLEGKGVPAARNAAAAIKRIGGPEAEDALIKALSTATDPDFCAQIMDSLGMLRCRRAVPLITDRLNDHRPLAQVPYWQRSIRNSYSALQGQLQTRGMPVRTPEDGSAPDLTVAAAAGWALEHITRDLPTSRAAHPVESQPAE